MKVDRGSRIRRGDGRVCVVADVEFRILSRQILVLACGDRITETFNKGGYLAKYEAFVLLSKPGTLTCMACVVNS